MDLPQHFLKGSSIQNQGPKQSKHQVFWADKASPGSPGPNTKMISSHTFYFHISIYSFPLSLCCGKRFHPHPLKYKEDLDVPNLHYQSQTDRLSWYVMKMCPDFWTSVISQLCVLIPRTLYWYIVVKHGFVRGFLNEIKEEYIFSHHAANFSLMLYTWSQTDRFFIYIDCLSYCMLCMTFQLVWNLILCVKYWVCEEPCQRRTDRAVTWHHHL